MKAVAKYRRIEFSGVTKTELASLRYALTVKVPVFQRDWQGARIGYEDRMYLFHESGTYLCPRCFSDRVSYLTGIEETPPESVPLREIDLRVNLLEFEKKVALDALEKKVALIVGPTSSGKTYVAAAIASAVDAPFLYLAHRRDIVLQTYQRFKEWLKRDVGLAAGSDYEEQESMVMTFQTAAKYPDLKRFKVVLVDEAHHCPALTFCRVLCLCDAPLFFGFTAT
ncbi:MAG: hypothetical protein DRP93_08595, partial [Candidatus Neomarinimicrobiota bacterium]